MALLLGEETSDFSILPINAWLTSFLPTRLASLYLYYGGQWWWRWWRHCWRRCPLPLPPPCVHPAAKLLFIVVCVDRCPPPAALLTLKTVLFYIFQCLCTVYPPSLHWLLMFRTHWRFNPANPQRPTVTKNNNNAPFFSLPLTLLSCIQDVPEWWWALYNIDQLHCPGSTPSGFIDNVFLQIGLVQRKASTPVLDNRLTFFYHFGNFSSQEAL